MNYQFTTSMDLPDERLIKAKKTGRSGAVAEVNIYIAYIVA